jgi:hypothetical protein
MPPLTDPEVFAKLRRVLAQWNFTDDPTLHVVSIHDV